MGLIYQMAILLQIYKHILIFPRFQVKYINMFVGMKMKNCKTETNGDRTIFQRKDITRKKRFISKIALPKKMKKFISKKMKSIKKLRKKLKKSDNSSVETSEVRFVKNVEEILEISCNNPISRELAQQYKRSSVRWLLNGYALAIELERMTYQFNTLQIQNLVPKDQGIYTCQMEYEPKQFQTVALYTLATKPGKEMHVKESRSLIMDCPSHTLHHMVDDGDKVWTFNGKDVTVPEPFLNNTGGKTFENAIKNMTGNWSCIVRDSDGIEWILFNYFVIIDPPPSLFEDVYFFAIDNPRLSITIGILGVFAVLVLAVTGMYFVEKSQKKSKQQAEDFKEKMAKMTESNDPELSKLINDVALEGLDDKDLEELNEEDLEELLSEDGLGVVSSPINPFNINENSRLLPQYSFNGSFMSISSNDTSGTYYHV